MDTSQPQWFGDGISECPADHVPIKNDLLDFVDKFLIDLLMYFLEDADAIEFVIENLGLAEQLEQSN